MNCTGREILAMENATATACHIPQQNSNILLPTQITIAGLVIDTIAVGIRVVTLFQGNASHKVFGWDDAFIFAAWVSFDPKACARMD
jgi:hypothetical protein